MRSAPIKPLAQLAVVAILMVLVGALSVTSTVSAQERGRVLSSELALAKLAQQLDVLRAVGTTNTSRDKSSLILRAGTMTGEQSPQALRAKSVSALTPLTLINERYWVDAPDSPGYLDFAGAGWAQSSDGDVLALLVAFYKPFKPFIGDWVGDTDSIVAFLDTDAHSATGVQIDNLGADYILAFRYLSYANWRATLARTPSDNSSTWTLVDDAAAYYDATDPDLVTLGVAVSQAALGNPSRIAFVLASLYATTYDDYVDLLPDPPSVAYYDLVGPPPITTTTTTLPPATTTTLPPTTTTTASPTTTTTLPPTTTTTTAPPAFVDVPIWHPYAAQITDMAARHVVDGYGNGRFGPDDWVKRQQFAKMVVLAMGYPVSEADVCPFTDVDKPSNNLYPDNYIAVAAARGITLGVTPRHFAPWNDITRAQLITMVARAANLSDPPASYLPPFGNFSSTHYPWARKAAFAGLLSGLQGMGPEYNFWAPASRGEVCVLLYNLLHR